MTRYTTRTLGHRPCVLDATTGQVAATCGTPAEATRLARTLNSTRRPRRDGFALLAGLLAHARLNPDHHPDALAAHH